MLQIQINGTSDLISRLHSVVDKNKVSQALQQGAFMVERDAKRLVRVKTGRLKNSINTIQHSQLKKAVGSGVQYAAAQEFGRPDLKSYGYTPYLRPAARMNKQKIIKLIKQSLEK